MDGFTGRLLDLNDVLNVNLGGWEDAQNRLKDVNTELGNNTDLNAALEQALKDGGTAAADAAEAEKRLAEERLATLDKEINMAVLARTMTEAELDDRVQQQQELLAIYTDALDKLVTEHDNLLSTRAPQDDIDANEAKQKRVVQLSQEADDTRYLLESTRGLVQARDTERQKVDALIGQADARTKLMQDAESMTLEATQDELRQIEIRREALEGIRPILEDQAQKSDVAADALAAVNDELKGLTNRETELIEGVLSAATMREQEADALSLLNNIIGVATDAPLDPRQLERLCMRAGAGLARTGGLYSTSSGDFVIAFSTTNRVPHFPASTVIEHRLVAESLLAGQSWPAGPAINDLFQAAVEATEEAILNSMFSAETMVGRDHHVRYALPIEETKEILRKHGRG